MAVCPKILTGCSQLLEAKVENKQRSNKLTPRVINAKALDGGYLTNVQKFTQLSFLAILKLPISSNRKTIKKAINIKPVISDSL